MTTYIEELKAHCDIVDIHEKLGCPPLKREGSRFQGNCPSGHSSGGGRCLIIWPSIQAFTCKHCDIGGDVINLVKVVKKYDFREAVDWLADHAGMPRMATRNMTEEERAKHEERIQEQKLIYDIMTEASKFYHGNLLKDEEIINHLHGNYGLSDETIETYQIGYSLGHGLEKHLVGQGYNRGQIFKSGLFVKFGDRLEEVFNGRILFPYWKSGKAVYFIGRKTARTPDADWEKGKYRKLPTDPQKHAYISPVVENRFFYGEDSIRGAEVVYVAEGVTDCLAMLQAGYPTISPVTTRFRDEDTPHLLELTKRAKTIYLVPDAEENEAGIKGAMDSAAKLEAVGKSAYIVSLPRPEGVGKVDAADFLKEHTKDDLDQLVKEAKTALQHKIDAIAAKGLGPFRLSDELELIKENLVPLPDSKRIPVYGYMKKALNLKTDFMKAFQKEVKQTASGDQCDVATEGVEKGEFRASFPELVDLVEEDGQVAYLVKLDGKLEVAESFPRNDTVIVPPPRQAIPFNLVHSEKVLEYADSDNIKTLYSHVYNKLKTVSILPSDAHYHLCSVFVFFTYVWEGAQYYPYIWFHGVPERGKSRIAKAMTNISYRGLLTETLNEANIFRFADRLRGTLAFDLYEISERAQKKDSHDLLLGRYERGMTIARVINPDKGAFRDTDYYAVSGPTILCTNLEIPSKDPLRSRCIKIVMPEARSKYPNNTTGADLDELKARLTAFRARHLGEELPYVEKPTVGRLGDLLHPLLCVAQWLPKDASDALMELVTKFEEERRQSDAESLAGRIADVLWQLRDEIKNGRLSISRIRDKLNEGIDERYHIAPQTLGRELSAMGDFPKKKSHGEHFLLLDPKMLEKLWQRYTPEGYGTFGTHDPMPLLARDSEGAEKNAFGTHGTLQGDNGDGVQNDLFEQGDEKFNENGDKGAEPKMFGTHEKPLLARDGAEGAEGAKTHREMDAHTLGDRERGNGKEWLDGFRPEGHSGVGKQSTEGWEELG